MTDITTSTDPGLPRVQATDSAQLPASQPASSDPGADGTQAAGPSLASTPVPSLVDAERRATELAILDSLRTVVDPEIGMNVVELALIKQIILGPDRTEIKMILTTPFCPYAGMMIQQVRDAAEQVVGHDVKITLLAERWDPRDAGLAW